MTLPDLREGEGLESQTFFSWDQAFRWLVLGISLATAGVLFWLGGVIFQQALPAIRQFGWAFLWNQDWDVGNLTFGALPYLYGTLVSSGIALLIALPVGLAVALITSENFLPGWVRSPLAFVVELIAAIPSVVVGLWGILVMVPWLQPLQLGLHAHLGGLPIFGTEPFGSSMLAAGIILAIMILPAIAAISREVLIAIPPDLRSASMSLGATRWETIFRVLLPAGTSGIIGAAMLALGRALGETMAVTMVIGNSDLLSVSILDPGNTIPAILANQFPEALDDIHIGALMYLGLILFALTFAVNVAAVLMIRVLGFKRDG
ncbi:MAG: phosphate ABC transporter permease subunit PstC [Scytolyngbya sp. HA4215-MV1]|nr:phosphate ABC transporter permease subunit PstC [Scytolyngbya sp. HA4215-MV1]